MSQEDFQENSGELDEKKLKETIEKVQKSLQSIVEKQSKELKNDEEYQRKFYKLCNDIGVDPFSQKKGFLSGLLNKDLESFYKNLGLRVLGICLKTRFQNGGLIRLSELQARLNKGVTKSGRRVHSDDIRVAVEKLSVLSSSLSIIKVEENGQMDEYIKSADMEFSADSTKVLSRANFKKGILRTTDLGGEEKWEKELDSFVQQGLAWVDDYEGVKSYYFPTIIFESH